MRNGCTITQKYNRCTREKSSKYDQQKNGNPRYATGALVRGNANTLVISDDHNRETTSLEIKPKDSFS